MTDHEFSTLWAQKTITAFDAYLSTQRGCKVVEEQVLRLDCEAQNAVEEATDIASLLGCSAHTQNVKASCVGKESRMTLTISHGVQIKHASEVWFVEAQIPSPNLSLQRTVLYGKFPCLRTPCSQEILFGTHEQSTQAVFMG